MTGVQQLTVLYDPTCGFCVQCRKWLSKQPAIIQLRFVPQGSSQQRRLFPNLAAKTDSQGRPEELIVIDNLGRVYRDDKAWIMCFYALRDYRPLAMRLARPGMSGLARKAYAMVSRNRRALSSFLGMRGDDALRTDLQAQPEAMRCHNAIDALKHAKAAAAGEIREIGVEA